MQPQLGDSGSASKTATQAQARGLLLSGGEEGWPPGDLECQFPGLSFCPLPSCDGSPSKGVRRMLSVPWSSPHDTRPQTPSRASCSAPLHYSLLQRCRLGCTPVILATPCWLCKASRACSKLKGQEVRDRRQGVGLEPQSRMWTLQGSGDTSHRSGPWVLNTTSQGLIQHLC